MGITIGRSHHSSPESDISVSKLLSFETFANVLRVSVSENLVSKKKSRYRFRKIWSRKKSLGLGFGFGEFGLGKKSRFRFRKILSRKKSWFWFWKTWSRKRKNQSNKKESRPSKQSKSLFEF